jgi:NAD(P)-dependent dehydrogenase (short-subunit alcohol dehydrogenase family)
MSLVANKVIVITGGASGIGLAAARRFVGGGAKVVIASRRDSADIAAEIGAHSIRTDVSREDDVRECMAAVAAEYGRIDSVVCSAGAFVSPTHSTELTTEAMMTCYSVNTLAVLYAIKHAVPHMQTGGSFVIVTSLATRMTIAGYGAYAASKAATSALVRTAALELGPRGIRINEVAPSSVDTPMLRSQDNADEEIALAVKMAPLGRMALAGEVASVIEFLASDAGSGMTGQQLTVDCGQSAGVSDAMMDTLLAARV